jgi:hypothetical protein
LAHKWQWFFVAVVAVYVALAFIFQGTGNMGILKRPYTFPPTFGPDVVSENGWWCYDDPAPPDAHVPRYTIEQGIDHPCSVREVEVTFGFYRSAPP